MPEHDTFDLDAAFHALERDVADSSVPRGAGAAITTARRRRRTTVATVAAAAVLAAGGVVIGHGFGQDHAVEPTSTTGESDRPVPVAAPLDAVSLGRATAGWAGPWDNLDMNANPVRTLNPSCQINNDESGSSSVNGATGAFQTSDGHYVQFGATRWNEGAGAHVATLTNALEACPGAKTTEVTYTDGTHVLFVELQSLAGSPTQWAIVARGHDQLGLEIAPTTGLTDEVQVRLADAMVAGLEADAGLTSVPQGGVGRMDPAQTAGQVWAETLQPALTGWATPWNPKLPQGSSEAQPGLSLPNCVGSIGEKDNGNGLTINVGRDGYQEVHWFPTESAATQTVADLQQGLAGCSTPYEVHTVTLPSGRPVVVAAGPQVVLWFTRVASHVLVLQLPAGDTAPPDDVSIKVGQVIEQVLEQPAATTVSPGETNVPDWLKKGIADAPTFGP